MVQDLSGNPTNRNFRVTSELPTTRELGALGQRSCLYHYQTKGRASEKRFHVLMFHVLVDLRLSTA